MKEKNQALQSDGISNGGRSAFHSLLVVGFTIAQQTVASCSSSWDHSLIQLSEHKFTEIFSSCKWKPKMSNELQGSLHLYRATNEARRLCSGNQHKMLITLISVSPFSSNLLIWINFRNYSNSSAHFLIGFQIKLSVRTEKTQLMFHIYTSLTNCDYLNCRVLR